MTMLTGLYPACGLHSVVTQSIGPPGLVNPIWSRYHRPPGPSAWPIFSRCSTTFFCSAPSSPRNARAYSSSPVQKELPGSNLKKARGSSCAAFSHLGLSHGKAFDAALHLRLRMIRQKRGCGPLLGTEDEINLRRDDRAVVRGPHVRDLDLLVRSDPEETHPAGLDVPIDRVRADIDREREDRVEFLHQRPGLALRRSLPARRWRRREAEPTNRSSRC